MSCSNLRGLKRMRGRGFTILVAPLSDGQSELPAVVHSLLRFKGRTNQRAACLYCHLLCGKDQCVTRSSNYYLPGLAAKALLPVSS